ncbi:NAD(P)/FAD-dependent oxidoreductase [Mechercharimyces sp. CAU 1602]|uniref:flavin-containing monooxygenase n=1 Tax=Mechercharimyces sp. CAU 1602 TaxID=2973933 RepID=UPI0021638629|nr:NAD(P)/FAD-dependent oxidoreductase [Mechercharimyces sp. CAU 1602]MCS1351869.1 NAD(P)/FAD-dependent oxidoreductase [Mechercharimyces sp. CAU 1602]
MNHYDVIVIGAGQAGLAVGYYLQETSLSFCLFEAHDRIGLPWHQRYDSLHLFTPRRYSALPGCIFPGKQDEYPHKEEVVTYLQQYAKQFALPIQFDTRVRMVRKEKNIFRLTTSKGEYTAERLVVATGPFQQPARPSFADQFSPEVTQLHSAEYRHPGQLRTGNVIVIGGGNSGAQIAAECAPHYETFISVRHPLRFVPERVAGHSIFWYYDKLGFLDAALTTRRGAWLKRQPEKIYGTQLKELIKQRRVEVKAEAVGVSEGHRLTFAGGSSMAVDNVIWATGYRSDYSWLHIEKAFDEEGELLHEWGSSPVSNLYFVGLRWLSSRGSALLGWVKKDAKRVVKQIREL